MLYEFLCDKCDVRFEKMVKMGTERAKCPKCGKLAHKIISAANFVVRGYNADNLYSGDKRKSKKKKE